MLVRGDEFESVSSRRSAMPLALLFLRMHGYGLAVNQIFWGLWPVPFGLLVMRSGLLPRILGVLLIVNGVAYVVASLTVLLMPDYSQEYEKK